MVHFPGPVISPTRDMNDMLERRVTAHPDVGIEDIRRLHPHMQSVSRRALEELVARIRQRGKGQFKPVTTFG
ncbi:MAG: hypothetical protein A3D94_02660 [Alphaproteobacteria bacterium RIFCSPHIGHO2_12_FULL_66_14]|jgi:hypothetical protein|nr:MAG: hypothetical protein A3D94_02660 [Alphaproteobacteria bacterium RIFCSPHIGHO2_12_FULL_66_14]